MTDMITLTARSKALLANLAKAGKVDLRPILKQIGVSYRKDVKAVFDHEQPRDVGLRWKALSPKYAKRKEKKFPGKTILRASDRLYNSMISANAPDSVNEIGKVSAEFGTSVPYAVFHDDTEKERKKIPLRNFSIPGDSSIRSFKKTLNSAIIKNFRLNGIKIESAIL